MRTRERINRYLQRERIGELLHLAVMDMGHPPPGLDPGSKLAQSYALYPTSPAGMAERRAVEAQVWRLKRSELFVRDLVSGIEPSLRVMGSHVIVEPNPEADRYIPVVGGYRKEPNHFGITYDTIVFRAPARSGELVSFGRGARKSDILTLYSALHRSGIDEGWMYARMHRGTKRQGRGRYVEPRNGRAMLDSFAIDGWSCGPTEGLEELKAQLVASDVAVYEDAADFEWFNREDASRNSVTYLMTAREESDYELGIYSDSYETRIRTLRAINGF